MSENNLLSFVIFLPLIGVVTLMFLEDTKQFYNNITAVSLLTSITTFICVLFLVVLFEPNALHYQFVTKVPWLYFIEVNYHVGIDGISLLFIILTTIITPLAIMFASKFVRIKLRSMMVALLVLETLLLGTFSSLDAVLFYLFFEGTLLPMLFIIGIWGGEKRFYAAKKFFLYTFFGSVFMLVAIVVIYFITGTMDFVKISQYNFTRQEQCLLWWAFFIAFAVKIPMIPLHTWLPNAHVQAPTSGSVMLASILLKMGGYGFLRISLPFFPTACIEYAPIVFALSIIAIIYGSLLAMAQQDIKKLIAYSSIAHMGFVTFGIYTFTYMGVQGAIFQMISHGIISAGLFFCIGILYERLQSRNIDSYGGLANIMPNFSVFFMICTLGAIGLPATVGFVGEFMVTVCAFKLNGFYAFGLVIGIILSAVYMLLMYQKVIWGKNESLNIRDLIKTEKVILMPIILLIVILGLYPMIVFNISNKAVQNIALMYNNTKKQNYNG